MAATAGGTSAQERPPAAGDSEQPSGQPSEQLSERPASERPASEQPATSADGDPAALDSAQDEPTPADGAQPRGAVDGEQTEPATAADALRSLRERSDPVPWWQRALSLFGIGFMLLCAWLLSSHKRLFPWRLVAWGVGLQLTFAVLVLKTEPGLRLFRFLNDGVVKLLDFTNAGSRFVFGDAVDSGFSIALNVLPTILFFSSLMAVLYYLGIVQKVVNGLAKLMGQTMKTSGAETLSAAANIFVGQTEAPLVVKPYVERMTLSELNAVMVGGFATVAGGVMAGYVDMLQDDFPEIAGHLIAASVLSAPAALAIAKIMLPETERPETTQVEGGDSFGMWAVLFGSIGAVVVLDQIMDNMKGWVVAACLVGVPVAVTWVRKIRRRIGGASQAADKEKTEPSEPVEIRGERVDANLIDAAARGAGEGLKLALNVGAMLLAFIALVALTNALLGVPVLAVNEWFGTAYDPWTLEGILGVLFQPIAYAMGVAPEDCMTVGTLLGEKLVVTEFVAYGHLAEMLRAGEPMQYRSVVIATYALCGFANFGSIAIQIGGISAIAPSRRSDLARLGLRAMIGGTLAACMTATIAGIFV